LPKSATGVGVREIVLETVRDAFQQEQCVMVARESSVPSLCPIHNGERARRHAHKEQYSCDEFAARRSCRAHESFCNREKTHSVEFG
jgi:hypothetical protein